MSEVSTKSRVIFKYKALEIRVVARFLAASNDVAYTIVLKYKEQLLKTMRDYGAYSSGIG